MFSSYQENVTIIIHIKSRVWLRSGYKMIDCVNCVIFLFLVFLNAMINSICVMISGRTRVEIYGGTKSRLNEKTWCRLMATMREGERINDESFVYIIEHSLMGSGNWSPQSMIANSITPLKPFFHLRIKWKQMTLISADKWRHRRCRLSYFFLRLAPWCSMSTILITIVVVVIGGSMKYCQTWKKMIN